MSEISIKAQVACIEEMVESLKTYCQYMEESVSELQKAIHVMRMDSLTTEFEDTYQEQYYTRLKAKTDQVIGDIRFGHIRYLEEVKEGLIRTL